MQATEGEDEFNLNGWDAPNTSGALVDKGSTPSSSACIQFLELTGIGSPLTFTFNGFQLQGTTGQTVALEAFDLSGNPISGDTASYSFSNHNPVTLNENRHNVGKIQFTFVGSGVSMDNVEINDSVSSVPEPFTIVLFGAGLLGLAGWRFRRA
jgi:hypothetical protein